MKKIIILYFFYNFIKTFFILPEQSFIFLKKDITHLEASEVLSNVITINNILFFLLSFFLLDFLENNYNKEMIFFAYISKEISILLSFLYFNFDLDIFYYNFINIIPILIGDDLFFFIGYNNLISKTDNSSLEKTKLFSYSTGIGLFAKTISYYFSIVFLNIINKSYFYFYFYFFFFVLFFIVIIFFFILKSKINFIYKAFSKKSLILFFNTIKELKENKNFLILLTLNILQPPVFVIDNLLFLETKYKFDWSTEKFGYFKTTETILSGLFLILCPIILKIDNKKKLLLFSELIIIIFISLIVIENEYLYLIILLFNSFQFFYGTIIKSSFSDLGKNGIYFILYSLSLNFSGFINMLIYSFIYKKTYENETVFIILLLVEFIILILTYFFYYEIKY